MRVLITGGSGFLGWNAVRHFCDRGNDVITTFRRLPHYLHFDGCLPVELDLADGAAIDRVVARFQPDSILHLAAIARPQLAVDADQLQRVNVDATARLATLAAERSIPILYVSTDLVYPPDAGTCDESTPVASTLGGYAASKLAGEEAVRSLARQWIVVRSTLLYGDGPPDTNSFLQFIDGCWARGERAPLFIDQMRSFLFVEDLCRAMRILISDARHWNRSYVCGGPRCLSRADFGALYADHIGVDRANIEPMRASDLQGYVGGSSTICLDTTRLRATGWAPSSLEETFDRIVERRTAGSIARDAAKESFNQ